MKVSFFFIFRQKLNRQKSQHSRPHIRIAFPSYPSSWANIEYRFCGFDDNQPLKTGVAVCDSYANHGHCPQRTECQLSHDIDDVIRRKDDERARKNARKRSASAAWNDTCSGNESAKSGESEGTNGTSETKSTESNPTRPPLVTGGHRAGFDAFMTGFTFATILVHHTKMPVRPESFSPADIGADKIVNKIYLVSKDYPLLLHKSKFAKYSGGHVEKFKKIM